MSTLLSDPAAHAVAVHALHAVHLDPPRVDHASFRRPRTLGDVARALNPARRLYARWLLSKAKHPSLAGHPRLALRLARLVPAVEYDETTFFRSDGAPTDVASRRRAGFARLSQMLRERAPRTHAAGAALADGVSDAAFVAAYRVPFQYRRLVREALPVTTVVDRAEGARVRDLGLVLGAYHPVVLGNVDRPCAISGMDEVSFHMSGTEAVMQAVRLARYHTGRAKVVRFAGALAGGPFLARALRARLRRAGDRE